MVFKLKVAILIGIPILLFSNCNKDEEGSNTVIFGKIKDARSGVVASNVSVKFLIQGIVDGVFNNNFQQVYSTTTDGSGNYRVEFEKGTPSVYRFEIEGEGYFFSQQDYNPDQFSSDSDNEFDLELDSQAWLKLRIVNEGTVSGGDQIVISLTTMNNDCQECCQDGVFEFEGAADFTSFCQAFGNSIASVDGIITDPFGGITEYTDQVQLQAMDTTELLVSY